MSPISPGDGRTPPAPPRGWTWQAGSAPTLRSSPAQPAHWWRVMPGHGPWPPVLLVWDPHGRRVTVKRSTIPSQAALLAQALL